MIVDIPIRNRELIRLLDYAVETFIHKYDIPKTNSMFGKPDDDPEDWVGSAYRDRIIAMGVNHDGAPENARSYGIKPELHKNKDTINQYRSDFAKFDIGIRQELALKTNALSQLYPPTGFIGWHNNANASGYNLIFTWSETGDGWFKYIDKYGQEITVPDKKGWTLKATYFGTYEEKNVCYHAAYTNCWRMTHSFVLGYNQDYWLDCIDHITTP